MKLFLASQAKSPESIKKLEKFVGTPISNKKIAYIPTASNGEYFGSWRGGGSIKVVNSLSNNLDIIELESFSYQDISAKLKNADIIWMAGGMTGYLLYWLRRTETDKLIIDLVKGEDKIYVGSSAGSMACAPSIHAAEWLIDDEEPGASIFSGLGLIDFEIYPHFEDELYEQIKEKWDKKNGRLCLLKDDEVIVRDGDGVNILGEERFIG